MGPITQPSNGYYHHHSSYDYLGRSLAKTSFQGKCTAGIADAKEISFHFAHIHPKHICSQGVTTAALNASS